MIKKTSSLIHSGMQRTILFHRCACLFQRCACALLLLWVSTSFLGCSGANPEIYQLEVRIQAYWKYPFESQERLLVQIYADDEDGFDEIYEVYVINDEEELYWRATRDEWDVVSDGEEKQWIVLTHIYSERHNRLPRGEYRVVLLDFSGFRVERSVNISDINSYYNQSHFPILSLLSGKTYLPVLNVHMNSNEIKLYLELAFPSMTVDVAGNPQEADFRKNVSLLGKDGEFYQIERNVPIKFVLNNNARANVFVHYVSDDGMIFTSGPFGMEFNELIE